MSEVAYQVFSEFAKTWGDKYVTSNVKIFNAKTGQYEHPGSQYRYFTTPKGKPPIMGLGASAGPSANAASC